MIASRSLSIAASVLELETPMTIDSLPFASRIFTERAPRLAGSSDISSSFTAWGAGALGVGADGELGEVSELA